VGLRDKFRAGRPEERTATIGMRLIAVRRVRRRVIDMSDSQCCLMQDSHGPADARRPDAVIRCCMLAQEAEIFSDDGFVTRGRPCGCTSGSKPLSHRVWSDASEWHPTRFCGEDILRGGKTHREWISRPGFSERRGLNDGDLERQMSGARMLNFGPSTIYLAPKGALSCAE